MSSPSEDRRPILVGERPPRAGASPLSGRTGFFLARLAGLDYPRSYERAFERVNLVDEAGEAWPAKRAMLAASSIARRAGGRRIVALGELVAIAFGVRPGSLPRLRWDRCPGNALAWIAIMPRSSGRCWLWNDPAVRADASAFMRELAVDGANPPSALAQRWLEEDG